MEAIEGAFGGHVDYAMLVKMYGEAPEGTRRYSLQGFVRGALKVKPYKRIPLFKQGDLAPLVHNYAYLRPRIRDWGILWARSYS